MNAEELLQNIEGQRPDLRFESIEGQRPDLRLDVEEDEDLPQTTKECERLSAVVAGGNSKQYLGKELQLSDIDTMKPEQIRKLYCKYEARLGASMTKTLGNTFINLYIVCVQKYFNVINPPKLIQDLEEDPFINNGLTNICCELYYRFGMYLAPFTAMLTTARHIEGRRADLGFDFQNKENIELENDD